MLLGEFEITAKKLGIIPGENIIVALSGGADSAVMLHLLIRLGAIPVIAHCNFCLRGKESDKDEEFVHNIAGTNKLRIYVKRFDTEKEAKKRKLTIQEAARELRYEWFSNLSEKLKIDKIAIAHNSGDVAETFIINLMRGSGLNGLAGIPLQNGKIVRPLLFAERKEIETYASENGIKFRNDSSNKSDKYLRNKIRHHLLPLMNEIRPGTSVKIHKTSELINLYRSYFEKSIEDKSAGIINKKNNKIIINRKGLSDFSHPLLMLHHFLTPLGFSTDTILRLVSSEKLQAGKKFFSPNYTLTVTTKEIVAEPVKNTEPGILVIGGEGEFLWNDFLFIVKLIKNDVPENGSDVLLIDEKAARMPWTVRCRQNGDKMKPFGLKGSKKISDLLTDASVPSDIKSQWPVMLQDDEIIWLPGIRSSEKLKVIKWSSKKWRVEFIKPER